MKFEATVSTEDGRLTAGKIYLGSIVFWQNSMRIVVYDNLNQWMTFNPKVFVPGENT